ncbi:MAG TPA: rhamnogalacturonan acetylesterase [Tepidisphaeraceae bacterium]|nr:rhamnogalacturonan acetylesterase [Tepidisphaeraceae bacterium]
MLLWCAVLSIGIAGTAAARPATQQAIDPKLPTLWIIGDSTVRNGRDNGNNGQWGWGNPIAMFFDTTRINVQNRALGGTSSRSFRNMGLWEKILGEMKPGDFVIMQFGHNDSGPLDDPARARGTIHGNGEQTREIDNPITKKHEIVRTYGWYLRQYVAEAKAKGAREVIICSPIPRNAWTAEKVNRNTSYTRPAAEAAEQSGADFIDLNEIVATRYDAEGRKKVTDTYFPEKEVVHPDWAGAVLNAQCVVDGLKRLEKSDLAAFLRQPASAELQNPPTGKAR